MAADGAVGCQRVSSARSSSTAGPPELYAEVPPRVDYSLTVRGDKLDA